MSTEFDDIIADFRRYAFAYSHDWFCVYAFPESIWKEFRAPGLFLMDVPFLKGVEPVGSGINDGEKLTFAGLSLPGRRTAFSRFVEVATRAGINLPTSVKAQTGFCDVTNPATNWLAAMWLACPPEKGMRTEKFPTSKNGYGWTWLSPFSAAVAAANQLELTSRATPVLPQDGEWSHAFSKAEIARRVLGKGKFKARARDIEPLWKDWEKRQLTNTKWTVRLDTLPANYRKALERPN